jgi:hypothetical protein
MLRKILFGREGRLRNGWWILAFYLLLGGAVVAMVALSGGGKVPASWQLAAVLLITVLVQALRRQSLLEVTGRPGMAWLRQLAAGALLGAGMWALVTAGLLACGATRMTAGGGIVALTSGLGALVSAAVLEELLFRGFVFQRLRDGLGPLLALLITSAHFLLVHLDALPPAGLARALAMANIFIAALAFGLAFLRTASLALPIGLHVFANLMQGLVLGFGVSGHQTPHLFTQELRGPDWLTGGAFGLEASLPGTLAIAIVAWMLWRRREPAMASQAVTAA